MRKASLLGQGLRFGMMLQLAVGPVCLFALNAAVVYGFWRTLPFVAAVVLADALYVSISALGIAVILQNPRVRKILGILGGLTLLLFGMDLGLGVLGFSLIPGVSLCQGQDQTNLFSQGLILTLSNPLTILFWSGVFASRVAQSHWKARELMLFALGCVLSTALFLSGVAAVGGLINGALPPQILSVLNALVGLALIYYGVRMLLRQQQTEAD